jgi:hypothetical protein
MNSLAPNSDDDKARYSRYYEHDGMLRLIFYTMSAEVIHSRLVAILKTA